MEEEEQVEWDDVNKLLQHHGFKPVRFADPVENRNHCELVLLDKKSCGDVRTMLRTMLTDSDRRQTLIQELNRSNNKLKEEAQQHMSRSAVQSQRISELERLLDQVKTRVQVLEERYLGTAVQQHSTMQQLLQDKRQARNQCQSLEQQLSTQQEEHTQLQKKLYFTVKEEEKRLAQQDQMFREVLGRSCQKMSATDQQVMEVVDFYEIKLTQLQDELRAAKGELESVRDARKKMFSNGIQKQQQQVEELKREVGRLKEELDSRPTLKEAKLYKYKLRRLEEPSKHSRTRTSREEHLSQSDNIGDNTSTTRLCALYLHLLEEIKAVVTNPNAPLPLHRQKPSPNASDLAGFQALLPTLETWSQQLHLLKALHSSLEELSVRLMPWQPLNTGTQRVEDMMLLVDTMLENTLADDDKALRSPTRHTLSSFVSHFQKLFDVPSLNGVYPRMNEVYTRLGEMTNAMRNLREVLELDSQAAPAQVVNHVTRLVASNEQTPELHHLLRDTDIQSIIVKVRQHEEFFPAFQALVTDILHTLGVTRLDDIVPTLKCLKQTLS
ncbi:centrosomal protein of 70 kDa [Gouania willdenowi]|uniref:centrosomal protein of 70 kDa n=1 Tax=Gouania willdenowi TaxID=441366 RepID=UPI0010546CDC|nr:centrosomal protein of 70 kDa [Gouania willdenowi]